MISLSIRQKLVGGFLLVVAAGAFGGVMGIMGMKSLHAEQQTLIAYENLNETTKEVVLNLVKMGRSTAFVAGETHVADRANLIDEIAKNRDNMFKGIDQLKASPLVTPEELKLIEKFVETNKQAREIRDSVFALVESGDQKAAFDVLIDKLRPVVVTMESEITAIARGFEEKMVAKKAAAEASFDRTVMGIMILIGITIAMSIAVSLWLSFWIINQIKRVAVVTGTLGLSSGELSEISAQVGANAEETSKQAGVVASASEEMAATVTTVAAAAEEMTASINDIAKSAQDASRAAGDAVQIIQKTVATVTKLGVSSQEIGNVIKTIQSIASQTNLLALNATIEAARAGDAGKGFAVVAHEVKDLANETAQATQDISARITAIQQDTQEAVRAIEEINTTITRMNSVQTTIASAVEEQTATTSEISRNIAEAATAAAEITSNISGVAQAATSAATDASRTRTAASQLSDLASDLRGIVDSFRISTPAKRSENPIPAVVETPSVPVETSTSAAPRAKAA